MSEIRLAAPSDFAAIHAVEISAGILFAGTHMDWAVGETTNKAVLADAVANGLLWVAEEQEKVQGFLLAEVLGKHFLIGEVAVDQRFRGQRIGAALIEMACFEAEQRGYELITLTTDRTLAWNAPQYTRLGFQIVDAAHLPEDLATLAARERNPLLRCVMQRQINRDKR